MDDGEQLIRVRGLPDDIHAGGLQQHIEVLAKSDTVRLPPGKQFTLEGVCIDDSAKTTHLTMRLGGADVLDVQRPAQLGNGVPSLQAWTHPVHAAMEIHWHDFTVSAASG